MGTGMDIERFRGLVARLEQESEAAPGRYRAKVAALAALGFGILALFLATIGLGLLIVVGGVVALAFTGATALILLAKFGKILFLLVIPLWYLVKSGVQALFFRMPPPEGREVTRSEAPALFEALHGMRRRMRGPRFHHVLVIDGVNAAVVQRPAFGLVGWPRNYLLLGLPLLDSLPPDEALAVVAHEYGHVAGSHGHFSAFIYRLRLTWSTIDGFAGQVQGWLGKLVAPLVQWYAPYFNAYTFVLARADEYHADAASAQLVGGNHAATALKRVNVAGARHENFMRSTFERIEHEPNPPGDLMQRWAAQAQVATNAEEASQWLREALDRQANAWDTHPPLRARLAALAVAPEALDRPPPPWQGVSAAQAWFGDALWPLRRELEGQWAEQVSPRWIERHVELRRQRERLNVLRTAEERSTDEQLEVLQLTMQVEPAFDPREGLAGFNAAHPDHPLGLFLEGVARLEHGERAGLALLDRAMALDAECTKPACERAFNFLTQQGELPAADAYADRWRQRDAHDQRLAQQAGTVDVKTVILQPHGLDEAALAGLRAQLTPERLRFVKAIRVARRTLEADPQASQLLVGVSVSWWGQQRGRQQEVVDHLIAIDWPGAVLVVSLDGPYSGLRKKFDAVADGRLH